MLNADREALAMELSSLAERLKVGGPATEDIARGLESVLTRLGARPGSTDDSERARRDEAFGLVTRFACAVDDLVWSAWSDAIAPGSHLVRRDRLAASLDGYLRGQPGTTQEMLEVDLAALRLVTAAMIAAIGRGGRGFAHQLSQRLSPDAIRASVPTGLFGHPARCWAHYVSLAGGLTPDALVEELMRAVRESARQLAEGRASEPPEHRE